MMPEKNFPWRVKRGYPLPLGVTVLNEGINFALFSRHASQVVLVVELPSGDQNGPLRYELSLGREENRTGDIWHILIETTDTELSYGYRLFGRNSHDGCRFTPERILIDPYCHALTPRRWGELARYGEVPCCRIPRHDFDWQHDRPLKTPLSETIIYELHVRGFTQQAEHTITAPGTYRGLIEKIPYLKQLGITAVELLPVTEFDENDTNFHDPKSGERLKNFWGYNPVSFLAVKSAYAHNPDDHINEFKSMVRALHQAGIEVILDIVYNHTGEGGYDGITSSFRGIDNPIYYLLDPTSKEYLNFSGCGNTFNCNHPVARSLIRESLRYWVMEMHVDGFRFDLASILGRDQAGNVLTNPPMIELIAEDPVLRDTKIIAEAWDAAGLYQVGSFSTNSRWGEWNGKFRDDIRSFMAGHEGTVTKLATRLAGSSDLYQASGRGPLSSINFITSHDGFTLSDLVSYNHKHNLSNGENNRDGDNHNLSWNSGYEGAPAPAAIKKLRARRIRSLLTILMLSQGVPMITAGDEFGRSQLGNNNAWCQDNSISWLDWKLCRKNQDLLRFFRQCIELRRRHPVFRREEFFAGPDNSTGKEKKEIQWQYLNPDSTNWSENCHGLGMLLSGSRKNKPRDDDFFMMINGSSIIPLDFTVPVVPHNTRGRRWHLVIDTAASSPLDIHLQGIFLEGSLSSVVRVEPMTVKLLQSMPIRP
ncbi:glycogen debranching protein GlgX [Desulfopila aestuarii]|uniref:Glycogen operon protein n=1 Tax=Desulfopila aestuarii DSM 18488 TaxID=1121416 RepID=A0A1M7Y7U5_9BACT|nr:glycogen debranching protein GlgX [Desulfopila aestuarii]SHO48608.1 glycogen operon protein [Desulfopila aestuarii DSM 18488]